MLALDPDDVYFVVAHPKADATTRLMSLATRKIIEVTDYQLAAFDQGCIVTLDQPLNS